MAWELTAEQKLILAIAAKMATGESVGINAIAGSGKTFILKEIMRAHPQESFLYLVFNKVMQEEMSKKLRDEGIVNATVQTTHSLAYHELGLHGKIANYYDIKDFERVFGREISSQDMRDLRKRLKEFCSSGRLNFKDYPDVEKIFAACKVGILAFSHDMYLKYYEMAISNGARRLDRYDYVLLDEAQDTTEPMWNIMQAAIAKKVLVGDMNQNIYSFRNTVNVLGRKSDYFANLTTCFRCRQEILDKAYAMLRERKHFCEKMVSGYSDKGLDGSRALLCRTNAQILKLLFKLWEKNALDKIKLDKNPKEYLSLIVDMYLFTEERLEEIIEVRHIELFKKIIKNNHVSSLREYFEQELCDDYDLLMSWNICETDGERVVRIYEEVVQAWEESQRGRGRHTEDVTILTTGHKSKGREWDAVFLHWDFDVNMPEKMKKYRILQLNCSRLPKWLKDKKLLEIEERYRIEKVNEENLYYVAITRGRAAVYDFSTSERIAEDAMEKEDIAFIKEEIYKRALKFVLGTFTVADNELEYENQESEDDEFAEDLEDVLKGTEIGNPKKVMSMGEQITQWRKENPRGSRAHCAKDLGCARDVVDAWWNGKRKSIVLNKALQQKQATNEWKNLVLMTVKLPKEDKEYLEKLAKLQEITTNDLLREIVQNAVLEFKESMEP